MQAFKIEQTTAVPAVMMEYISLPTYFLDTLNARYRATVICYDASGGVVGNKEVEFTQEEYDNWGTDDSYIHNLIHEKLGTVRSDSIITELQ